MRFEVALTLDTSCSSDKRRDACQTFRDIPVCRSYCCSLVYELVYNYLNARQQLQAACSQKFVELRATNVTETDFR